MKASLPLKTPVSLPPLGKALLAMPLRRGMLQRCACGGRTGLTSECDECRKKRLQSKLRIGAPGDRYEHEADRAADAVMGHAPMPRLSRVAATAQRLQRSPCCCCADSVDITGGDFYRDKGQVGHRFEVPISFHYTEGDSPPAGASDCSMEWRERTSKTAPLLAETGKWIDVFPAARNYMLEHPEDQIPAVAAWDQRLRSCGAGESFTLYDDPFINAEQYPNSRRTLDFDLVVRSGTGCACTHAERHVYARQQLHILNGAPYMHEVSFQRLDAEPAWPAQGGGATPAQAPVQRKATGADVGDTYAPPSVHGVLERSGSELDRGIRRDMESRFGYDFGRVRIHTDAEAAASAADVQARAYTVGQHVVFGAGGYRPETPDGQRLLAHELAHVVQQRAGAVQRVQRESYTVEENRCTLTAHYSLGFAFLGHRDEGWTPAREERFLREAESQIEDGFNANAFQLVPSASAYENLIPRTRIPYWFDSDCPCHPGGLTPEVDVTARSQGISRRSADWNATVYANPEGTFVQSRAGEEALGTLDEGDVRRRGRQVPIVHEFGHSIGLHHPGRGMPGIAPNTQEEYRYTGRDAHGRDVAASDLMGVGMGLRPHYFGRWLQHMQAEYPTCGYEMVDQTPRLEIGEITIEPADPSIE